MLNAREKDHALMKSEILTRLVRLHRELAVAEAKAANSGSSAGKTS